MSCTRTLFIERRRLERLALVALATAALAVASFNAVGYLRLEHFTREVTATLAPARDGRSTDVAWSFPFEGSRPMVTVTVDTAEVAAGEAIDTSAVFGSRGWLRDAYVARLVAAEAESPAVERLVAELRRIRDRHGLDSDRYLELATTAVQAIPYGEVTGEVKMPAEVLASGSGVCTEKSLLLAAVLVHEGYDTVLWVFPTQRHVALGVRSARAQYRGTGYAFVETTTKAYVGQADAAYRSNGPVARPPRQIALGGWRPYTSGAEVEFILAELARAERLSASTVRYTSLARRPNTYRDHFAERAQEHWIASTMAGFILGNTHDRVGTYRFLRDGAPVAGPPQLLF